MSMDVKVKIGNLKHIIIILKYQTKGVGENEVSIRSLMNHRLANEKKNVVWFVLFFSWRFCVYFCEMELEIRYFKCS